jgi:hypothetical protein
MVNLNVYYAPLLLQIITDATQDFVCPFFVSGGYFDNFDRSPW